MAGTPKTIERTALLVSKPTGKTDNARSSAHGLEPAADAPKNGKKNKGVHKTEEGIFSETELGIIGAVLFFTYAVGKFTNGFLADRSNINRFMSTGLLVTALVNLFLGFVHSFIIEY